ncbi:MAG: hypothetical protein U1E73_02765 [Planctomycetota bacterium]
MRQCPTFGDGPAPLIQHRIDANVCQARQGAFFHKCHRCIYRGQAVDWQPTPAPLTIEVEAEAPASIATNGRAPKKTVKPARPRKALEPEAGRRKSVRKPRAAEAEGG